MTRKAGNFEVGMPVRVFVISRLGLFLLVYVSLVLVPVQRSKKFWHAFPGNRFLDGWARFDSGWYVRIAKFGYKNIPTGNGQDTNFFPLYPLTIRAVTRLTGGNAYLAGLVVSNLCFLFSLVGLYYLVRERDGPEMAARAVAIMAFNPFSLFYSAVYSESLFLFVIVFAFLACERGRYLLAGALAAAAGATRNVGVFVPVGLLLVVLRQCGWCLHRLEPVKLWILAGFVGPLSYMAYLGLRFGDPFLFLHAQEAWGTFSPVEILRYVFRTLEDGPVLSWGYPILFLFQPLLGILSIGVLLKTRRSLTWPYVLFSLLLILPAFLRFTGMGRYLIVVFPLFMALAALTEKTWVYRFFLIVEGALLILFSFMFSHWFWVA